MPPHHLKVGVRVEHIYIFSLLILETFHFKMHTDAMQRLPPSLQKPAVKT